MLLKELGAKFDCETSYWVLTYNGVSDVDVVEEISVSVEDLKNKFTNVGYELIEVPEALLPKAKRVAQKVRI